MFRSRRNTLVKRLWKSRIFDSNETSCTNEALGRNGPRSPLLSSGGGADAEEAQHVKAVLQSMLKRLKEKQLEDLVEAVESHGGENTGCVLIPRESLRLGRRGNVAPHVLCCQVWRWPELTAEDSMKRLPCCMTDDPTSVCCNPYHWSLRVPESPPPCYRLDSKPRVFIKTDVHESSVSTETKGSPSNINADGSSTTSSRQFWCNLAYWELRQRVGRLFAVFAPSVCVFQQLARGDGMCLSVLQSETSLEGVRRTREKIGHGMVLSREADGLWMYNRSDYPIFVNSPTLEVPESRTTVVKKVKPGYSLNIFDFELSEELKRTRPRDNVDGPYDPNSIRISFAKGWGPSYSRQFITSCPCWLEVLLSVNR